MKTCPVCKTQLFDDMEVCYGCMYTFGSKPELEQRAAEQSAQEQQAQQISHTQPVQSRTHEAPAASPMAGWSVRLEMRNEADPTRSWSMELAPTRPEPQSGIASVSCAAIA